MGIFLLIVGIAKVLTATLCNYIYIKFIFTKNEVVFIGRGHNIFLNLHRIMTTLTFFTDLIHSQRMFDLGRPSELFFRSGATDLQLILITYYKNDK